MFGVEYFYKLALKENVSAFYDTVGTFLFCTIILVVVTMLLNMIAFLE